MRREAAEARAHWAEGVTGDGLTGEGPFAERGAPEAWPPSDASAEAYIDLHSRYAEERLRLLATFHDERAPLEAFIQQLQRTTALHRKLRRLREGAAPETGPAHPAALRG